MTQQDFSEPAHRLENISQMQFFKAYAALRHLIFSRAWQGRPVEYLRLATGVIEHQLADMFDIPATTLVGKLVDTGYEVEKIKGRQGLAE